jgi:hypothetical protein
MSEVVFQNSERFNHDEDASIFQRLGKPYWYFRILKKPGWVKGYHCSLKTKNKEEAIKQAKIKYQQVMSTNQALKNCLFNSDDIKIATLRKGLGRLCEDKFKNLMMIKGYQVSVPVEDIWGYDFLVSKDGKKFESVQVKSTSNDGSTKNSFHLFTNHSQRIPYKNLVDYIAFISIMDDKVWLVPSECLPNKTGIALHELKKDYEKFIVDYSGV